MQTISALEQLKEDGNLRQLDFHFAKTVIASETSELKELTAFAAALVSSELGKGNTCIRLDRVNLSRPFGVESDLSAELFSHIPDASTWEDMLDKSLVVSRSSQTPLIINGGRLYLNRFWRCETEISRDLALMASESSAIDIKSMREYLNSIFPRPYSFLMNALQKATDTLQRKEACIDVLDIVDQEGINWPEVEDVLVKAKNEADLKSLDTLIDDSSRIDWQRVSVASALRKRLAIITGGPGTGKTTTVIKLLASLVHGSRINHSGDDDFIPPTIKLVAPTGKAAMRLTESIGNALQSLPLEEEVSQHIPTSASTLHRLLGATKGAAKFRFNAENKLHLDVLVVDEASMIDLPMMFCLVSALPPHAKLILLGDKDQLASVEAGSVLADFCSFSRVNPTSAYTSDIESLTSFRLSNSNRASAITDCISELKKSYRFHSKSGIGQIAKAVNSGSEEEIQSVIASGYPDINYHQLNSESYTRMIHQVADKYSEYISAIKSRACHSTIIEKYNQIRLLCAIRDGEFGLNGLNEQIENTLHEKGLIAVQKFNTWYEGRPVMVVRNDYSTGLYNGDIGITIRCPQTRRLIVIFEFPDGSIKQYQTCRIPDHETAYAMTIHKSQGSEFTDTFMVLPTKPSPIITRELVYTGITRAKKNLHLFSTNEVLARGARIKTIRHSGLSYNLRLAMNADVI
ncbi:exodeoxyribonuclease V subunit RecD [Vibrio chagasii]|nr:exodeoxyribonuclease V subunit RecD [Vibrio chagasii]